MVQAKRDWLLLVGLGVLWGVNFLAMKVAVSAVAPFQVAWLRALFGAVPVLLWGWSRRALKRSHIRHVKHFFAIALFSVVIPYVGLMLGTQRLPSGTAGAIAGIVPLLTAVLAALLLPGEALTPRKLSGLGAGLVGVGLVAQVWKIHQAGAQDMALGTLFVLLAGIGYAAGMVYTKRYLVELQLGPVALSCYQTSIAAALLTLFVPKSGVSHLLEVPAAFWSVVLVLGLLGTGVAFIIYFHLIEHLGASNASSVFYIPPVVALVIGSVIAHEAITAVQWVGAFVILIGVFMSKEGPKA